MSKVVAGNATQGARASPFFARGIPAPQEQQSVEARAWDVLCKRHRGESCGPASETALGLGLGTLTMSVYFPEQGYSCNSGGVGALEKLNFATQVGVKRGVHKQVTSK